MKGYEGNGYLYPIHRGLEISDGMPCHGIKTVATTFA